LPEIHVYQSDVCSRRLRFVPENFLVGSFGFLQLAGPVEARSRV